LNINDTVKVKLNDYGREYLRKQHEELFELCLGRVPYNPRKEDEEGYSSWQLWDLMNTFGPATYLGATELPFETEIVIE